MNLIVSLFAARWLGHGRASECYLTMVALLLAVDRFRCPA